MTERSHAPVKLACALVLLGALFGCSAGGFVPSGPHTMDQGALHELVTSNARSARLPAALVSAMIEAESHGDPSAVSRSGAQGLMQLMPDTAASYGVANAFDPSQNVSGGCRYMRALLDRYHRNVSLALAAYNAGPGAVDASHGVPPYSETRTYVARVNAALRTPAIY